MKLSRAASYLSTPVVASSSLSGGESIRMHLNTMLKRCNHVNILKLEHAYRIGGPDYESTLYLVTQPWAPLSLQRVFKSLDDKNESRLCPWNDKSISHACFGLIFKGFIDGLITCTKSQISIKISSPTISYFSISVNPVIGIVDGECKHHHTLVKLRKGPYYPSEYTVTEKELSLDLEDICRAKT